MAGLLVNGQEAEARNECLIGAIQVLYESVKQRKTNEILMDINNERQKNGEYLQK